MKTKNKTLKKKNQQIFDQMLELQQRNLNITIGWVDSNIGDGELLKETFDLNQEDLPAIRIVHEGAFYNQNVYMTTWVIDSYQRGVEYVWNGFTVAIRVPLRPRVTKNWLWLEYIVNYVAHDEDLLEQLMNA